MHAVLANAITDAGADDYVKVILTIIAGLVAIAVGRQVKLKQNLAIVTDANEELRRQVVFEQAQRKSEQGECDARIGRLEDRARNAQLRSETQIAELRGQISVLTGPIASEIAAQVATQVAPALLAAVAAYKSEATT